METCAECAKTVAAYEAAVLRFHDLKSKANIAGYSYDPQTWLERVKERDAAEKVAMACREKMQAHWQTHEPIG